MRYFTTRPKLRAQTKKLKIIALYLLLLPTTLLGIFGDGANSLNVTSAAEHLMHLFPLALLAVFFWQRPNLGGKILVTVASIAGLLSLIILQFPFEFRIINAVALFGPLFLAGYFFLKAANLRRTRYT